MPDSDIDFLVGVDMGDGRGKVSVVGVRLWAVRATFLAVYDICCWAMGDVCGELLVHD